MSIDFLNEWFTFSNVIDKKTCNKIKKVVAGNWDKTQIASVGEITKEMRHTGINASGVYDSKIRVSDIHWTTEQWIYDLTFPLMYKANKKAGWNLDVRTAESMQITRYKKGGFYTNHKDGMADSLAAYDMPNTPFLHGKVRKISMSLILNDNFEGGDLEFITYGSEEIFIDTIKPKLGDVIFFLSGVEHRVTPVTKGTRYSLVNWFLGPPIK